MHRPHPRPRWAAWMALAALLWAALAPAWAGVLRGQPPLALMPLCSAAGSPLAAAPDGAPADHPWSAGGTHCPWCSPQGDAAAPPPAPLPVALRPAGPGPRPVARAQAGQAAQAWALAQPRAPPRA